MSVDWTKPVERRDGRKVRVLCTDRKGLSTPVIVLVTDADGSKEEYCPYQISGIFMTGGQTSDKDIINSPVRYSRWTNKYSSYFGYITHHSKEEALAADSPLRLYLLREDYVDGKIVSVHIEPS